VQRAAAARHEDFEKYQPKDFSALVSASGD
jgi:hypothetical protein